jgi:hypothetical protein
VPCEFESNSSEIKNLSSRFAMLEEPVLPFRQVGSRSAGSKSTMAFFERSELKKVAKSQF